MLHLPAPKLGPLTWKIPVECEAIEHLSFNNYRRNDHSYSYLVGVDSQRARTPTMSLPLHSVEPNQSSNPEAIDPITRLEEETGFSSYISYLETYKSGFPRMRKVCKDLRSMRDQEVNHMAPSHCTVIDASRGQDVTESLTVRLNISSGYGTPNPTGFYPAES